MQFIKKISVRRLARPVFWLNLLEFAGACWYYSSQTFKKNSLWWVGAICMVVATLGVILFFVCGWVLDKFLSIKVFQSVQYNRSQLAKDFWDTLVLAQAMVLQTVLDYPIPKNKAIYRTSVLMHVTLFSLPQLFVQSINNQEQNLWNSPGCIVLVASSALMLVLAFLIAAVTDKHQL